MRRDAIAAAFIRACEDELAAPKPGNVHHFAPGHRMEAQDFIDSAHAAAGPLTAPGASVGARIFGAVEATWARVKKNTNLGIVLLCAPLAHAALEDATGDLRTRLARVLAGLTVSDAVLAYRAILRANPAGLGAAPQHDVAAPAKTTLLEAMRPAQSRDSVASQYAHDYEDIFGLGLPALEQARAKGQSGPRAILAIYVAFLSTLSDSHIARKWGGNAAEGVREEARAFAAELEATRNDKDAFAAALAWDRALKARGLNPGTSADLTVATLFADNLARILANAAKNG
jgi:triphosphoribosyl-dephospho-CoA synthase